MRKQPSLKSTRQSWIPYSMALLLILSACREEKKGPSGLEIEQQLLTSSVLSRDFTKDSLLTEIIKGINCITDTALHKRLVFAKDFNRADTSLVLVIPFKSLLGDFSSCAYSDLANRAILISPEFVASFNQKHTLNASNSLYAVTALTLLHEVGHFVLGKEGAFDVIGRDSAGKTGEMKMDTEPEYLGTEKRIEMDADSIAIAFVKKHVLNYKQMDCYSIASDVQLILPGIGFQLFGTRLLDHFGSSTKNLLRDPSRSHPNMELRIAFMNYFLTGLPAQKEMIDTYLYEREVAPVHRQELDPRLFQGQEKILPGDTPRGDQ